MSLISPNPSPEPMRAMPWARCSRGDSSNHPCGFRRNRNQDQLQVEWQIVRDLIATVFALSFRTVALFWLADCGGCQKNRRPMPYSVRQKESLSILRITRGVLVPPCAYSAIEEMAQGLQVNHRFSSQSFDSACAANLQRVLACDLVVCIVHKTCTAPHNTFARSQLVHVPFGSPRPKLRGESTYMLRAQIKP